jgi:transcription elongation GreA/GreB family factor
MAYEALLNLAKTNKWNELEKEWLGTIESAPGRPEELLPVIDQVMKAGQVKLADTLGWAWLSSAKESKGAHEALQLGRDLLVRLSDGDDLRDEILSLYRNTHTDCPDIEQWIERSGLKSGKSVRRALRFLDSALRLRPGCSLIDRTDEHAARIESIDLAGDRATVRLAKRASEMSIAALIEQYEVVDENDFRVLQQLEPAKIRQLLDESPAKLLIGILRAHNNKMNRDVLRALLVPRHLSTEEWSDWWTKLRTGVKKSPNLRIEGRSPMFLLYDPVGKTLEEEAWTSFSKALTPREWLEILEGYLRDTKDHKSPPDTAFLGRVQKKLIEHVQRFERHKEPAAAFATALVLERVKADGLPVSTDAHGAALRMLSEATKPVTMVAAVPDVRLWSLAVACVEQAFPDRWPELFAELILFAPAGQCDALAKRVEQAGKGDMLQMIVDRALADPGRFTDALMWVWRGPDLKTTISTPPITELLSLVLALVGPTRLSEGRVTGQTINDMRARVRTGLSSRSYGAFQKCLDGLDDAMAQTIRRMVERAEGLGPSVQEDMSRMLRARYPSLYAKPKVKMWDDDSVLYFTPAGLKRKEGELEELVNVKMRENAKAIGEAAAHGDLSENSEYKFALEERDLLRARVAKLNREISMGKLLEQSQIPLDHVSVGQRITLAPRDGAAGRTITILGFDEADIANDVYSYHSPLARSVLGSKPGDVVSMSFEDESHEYEIRQIEPAVG